MKIYYQLSFKLKLLKWYLFHLYFKISKYKHKHIWNMNIRCLICRKDKRYIDWGNDR